MKVESRAMIRVRDLTRWQRQTWPVRQFEFPPRVFFAGPQSVTVYPMELFEVTKGIDRNAQDLICRAYEKACISFAGTIRKSGRHFIDHLVETSYILRNVMEIKDPVLLAAGLLHDILEDTKVTYEELKKEFGCEVADLVDAETKLSKDILKEKRDLESLKKWIRALNLDPRVAMLKAADNLSNIKDQEVFPENKRIEHALETMEIYSRIMDAMGIWEMRVRLEDGAIRYLHPDKFAKTKPVYQRAVAGTAHQFDRLISGMADALQQRGIRARLVHRQRMISEVFRAMERQKKSLEELLAVNPYYLDYILIEVANGHNLECYRTLGILRDEVQRSEPESLVGFKPRNEEIKDSIAHPRPNGYRALQTTFYREGERGELLVTATTEQINAENRLGLAALGAEMDFRPGWQEKMFDWMGRLIDLVARLFDSNDLRKLIGEVTRRKVVYTSSGEKTELPVTATVLDFAFYNDPVTAARVAGAKVNGKNEDLSYRLKANDVVELILDEEKLIKPSWLAWAKTTTAAEHIREYLRQISFRGQRTLGLNALQEKTEEWFLNWEDIKDSPQIYEVIEYLSAKYQDRIAQLIKEDRLNLADFAGTRLMRLSPETLVQLIGLGEIEIEEFGNKFIEVYQATLKERERSKQKFTFAILFRAVQDRIGLKKRFAEALESIVMNVVQDHARVQPDDSAILTYIFEICSTIQQRQIENIAARFGIMIASLRSKDDAKKFKMEKWRDEELAEWRKKQEKAT